MKRIKMFILAACVVIMAAGCGRQSNTETESVPENAEISSAGEAGEGISSVFSSGNEELSPAQITTPEMLRSMRVFSKWDVKDTVDREFCTEILFRGDRIEVTGKGAFSDGNVVTIERPGLYYVTGTLDNGQIVVKAGLLDKVRIIFGGVDMTCEDSACLLVRMADKVVITLEEGTVNRFSDAGKPYEAKDGAYGVDAVLFAKEDLTINGSGTMIVEAGCAHGIVTKDDLVFEGGTVTVTAKDKGLVGEDSIRIRNTDLTVTAVDDAIHTKTDYKEGKGFVFLESGNVQLTSGDDAIHAATAFLMEGGSLTVSECKEGIEAATVVVGGGTVDITSNDDGINASYRLDDGEPYDAAGENDPHVQADACIRIEGGDLTIKAEGDGLDSNGTLCLYGGTVRVSGQTKEGSKVLDSGTGTEVDGCDVVTP